MAARQLAERFDATPLVDIDPERYFDFSTTRPIVRLDDDRQRSITWPENQLLAARVPAAARDVVILVGLEPQPQWRRFCRQVLGVAEAIEASTIVTLGALLADVPHTRPVQVFGGRGPCPPNPTRPRPLLLRGANRHRGGAHDPGG